MNDLPITFYSPIFDPRRDSYATAFLDKMRTKDWLHCSVIVVGTSTAAKFLFLRVIAILGATFASVCDLKDWVLRSWSIIRNEGLKAHLSNLIAILAFPILCAANLPFGCIQFYHSNSRVLFPTQIFDFDSLREVITQLVERLRRSNESYIVGHSETFALAVSQDLLRRFGEGRQVMTYQLNNDYKLEIYPYDRFNVELLIKSLNTQEFVPLPFVLCNFKPNHSKELNPPIRNWSITEKRTNNYIEAGYYSTKQPANIKNLKTLLKTTGSFSDNSFQQVNQIFSSARSEKRIVTPFIQDFYFPPGIAVIKFNSYVSKIAKCLNDFERIWSACIWEQNKRYHAKHRLIHEICWTSGKDFSAENRNNLPKEVVTIILKYALLSTPEDEVAQIPQVK